MNDDAQLSCPISFTDPLHLYSEALCIPSISLSFHINDNLRYEVNDLEIRCLSAGASIFRDAEHRFRWFLAPYAHVFITNAYNAAHKELAEWLLKRKDSESDDWLILCVTENESYTVDKLAERYFKNEPMNRFVIIGSTMTSTNELYFSTVAQCISRSFTTRFSKYEKELSKFVIPASGDIEGTFNLREYFILKDSVALMLQMMRLYTLAVKQYEEMLDVLLTPAGSQSFQHSIWPLPNDCISLELSDESILRIIIERACESVFYNVNTTRTKMLRNKLCQIELRQYIAARLYFLWGACAKDHAAAARVMVSFISAAEECLTTSPPGAYLPSTSRLNLSILATMWASQASITLWRLMNRTHFDHDNSLKTNIGSALSSIAQFCSNRVLSLIDEIIFQANDTDMNNYDLSMQDSDLLRSFSSIDDSLSFLVTLLGVSSLQYFFNSKFQNEVRCCMLLTAAEQFRKMRQHRLATLFYFDAASTLVILKRYQIALQIFRSLTKECLDSKSYWPDLCIQVLIRRTECAEDALDHVDLCYSIFALTERRFSSTIVECGLSLSNYVLEVAALNILNEEIQVSVHGISIFSNSQLTMDLSNSLEAVMSIIVRSPFDIFVDLFSICLKYQSAQGDYIYFRYVPDSSNKLHPGNNSFEITINTPQSGLYSPFTAEIAAVHTHVRFSIEFTSDEFCLPSLFVV